MNLASVIVLLVVVFAAVLALRKIIKGRGCSTGCDGCPHSADCNKNMKV
ncbi:MAG: FeoB-associated Cys-rich membrane protein [Bacteroidales bacterium]|nr:FeoB-associated Cys-rich membrane protein [Candidatus Cacconaster merdequi]